MPTVFGGTGGATRWPVVTTAVAATATAVEPAGAAAAGALPLLATTTAVASTGRAAAGCAAASPAAGRERMAVRCFSRSLTRLRSSVTSSLSTDASPPLPQRELLSPSCSVSCEEIFVVLAGARLRFIEMTNSRRPRSATTLTRVTSGIACSANDTASRCHARRGGEALQRTTQVARPHDYHPKTSQDI